MGAQVTLLGLDFGSTTSCAVAASATLTRAAGSGRVELGALEERYRSEMALTPFAGDALDLDAAAALLDRWLAEAGGVIVEKTLAVLAHRAAGNRLEALLTG